jgi:hypothetical protein
VLHHLETLVPSPRLRRLVVTVASHTGHRHCCATDSITIPTAPRPHPQALHYLETLGPSLLFDQLVAAAVSEAAALLGSCQGASLPAVARVVAQFREAAGAALRRGGGGVGHALAGADHAGLLAGDWGGAGAGGGFSDEGLELLLAEFEYLEQVVVAAESLCRRLPGQAELCGRIMATLLDGDPPPTPAPGRGPADGAGPTGTRRPQSGSRRGGGGGGALAGVAFMPVALAGPEERTAIGGWLAQAAAVGARRRSLGGGGGGGGGGSGGGGGGGEGGPGLGEPSHREWVILCCPAGGAARRAGSSLSGLRSAGALAAGGAGAAAVGAAPAAQPPSRMYVQEAEGEMRLAFTLVSQPCL